MSTAPAPTLPDTAARTALLELQRRDTRAAVLRESLERLQGDPELQQALARRRAAVAKAKELDVQRADRAAAVEACRQRLEESRQRLGAERARRDAGGSAREVSASQRQIDALTAQAEKHQAALGTAEQAAEAFEQQRGALMPRLRAADQTARDLLARQQERGAAERAEHEQLAAERPQAVAAVGDDALVARYERIRTRGGRERIAAAPLRGGVCGACGTELSPRDLAAVERSAELLACADCGALLLPQD